MNSDDAGAGPEARHADLHVDGEHEHRQHRAATTATVAPGSSAEPVAAEDQAHRADRAGDAHAGGEELEDQQRQRR